ncbi:hypothetical protein [Schaalia sp. JY-X159]|uniref:CT398-like coiled coil hairpin domain-containing protein n=1 Tax=Schaalia sp. JY-X159 TaxID=2758575 RepID=UPI00165DAAEB|nr:hypothetical protein [Schaalia sp. JY-X159]
MKVTHEDQLTLLELQETDLQISRLGHRIQSNPLHEKLRELTGRAGDLHRSVIAQSANLGDRQRKIDDVETEVAKVEQRRLVQQQRLDSGKVGIRDMSAVEHEIKKIVERRDQLELEVLELQEDYEKHEEFLAKTEAAVRALGEDEAKTRDQLAVDLAEPAAELALAEAKATGLRALLPDSVLDEYDHLRGRLGVLVVLRFEEGRLVNAPLELSHAELAALIRAPKDELWEAEDSGYLVVRV